MLGRVVPWEISWRAVLGLGCCFSSSWGVVVGVVFTFEVAIGVAETVGSVIAEGAMVACYLGLTSA
jgi:hypothetical protein